MSQKTNPLRVWPGGYLIQDVNAVTLVNNTLLMMDFLVPAGEIWKLISIKALNPDDVDRAVAVRIYLEAAATNMLRLIARQTLTAASAEVLAWPSNFADTTDAQETGCWADVFLIPGNIIRVSFEAGGASAGGTDADALVIEYLRLKQS